MPNTDELRKELDRSIAERERRLQRWPRWLRDGQGYHAWLVGSEGKELSDERPPRRRPAPAR
jgi:hypothetical protein